jgi:tetratricopeptide (TPR) repeat protein/4-amino-4-deoxy-L-arabinose transferase-like glycosyltransferase
MNPGRKNAVHDPVQQNSLLDNIVPPQNNPLPLSKYLLDYRLWLFCLGFIVIGVLSLNDTTLYTPDSPRYLIWARSLASFEGYKDISNPDPSRYVIHAPLYPLLLAPLAWLFTNILVPAKVLTIFFGVALIVLFYVWAAQRTSRFAGLLGAFFLAINPLTILFSNHVLSDIPFTAFVVLFFMLAEKMTDRPEEEKWVWFFVVVLTMGIFLREVGLTLLLGALAYLTLTRQFRRLLLIFTIPMLFYMIWHFRNEVYIAGIENPSMRNMKILLGHSFTGDNQSLAQELLARLRINLAVYANLGKGLLLFPQYLVKPFTVIVSTDPMMAGMNRILSYIQYPLILLQYGLFCWGVVAKWRDMKTTLLVLLFSMIYLLMVLLYPVNDSRFLVPLIVVVLYYAVIGGYDLAKRLSGSGQRNRLLVGSLIICCVLLAVPNGTWIYNYVANNREYLKEISDPSKPYITEVRKPEVFVRPVSLVGTWIADHSAPSTTILARWKELTFWLKGRKIIDTDPLLTLTLFEGILRDYNVGYIVALVTDPGIREFEFQMLQTKKFAFTSVYRAGSLEVIQVDHLYRRNQLARSPELAPMPQPSDSILVREANTRALFRLGVRALESGQEEEALNAFSILLEITRGSGYMGLFRGIALEFGGKYNEALSLFDQFRYQPQAGPFIKHAWYHQRLINELKNAPSDPSAYGRAMTYHRVSANYWDLGFRQRAIQTLDLCIGADSTFSPGYIFGMYYALQIGDTVRARANFARTQKVDSTHMMIKPIRKIFSLLDSVKWAKSPTVRRGYELSLAKGYTAIGLRDLSIDVSLAILEEDPNNVGALEILAQAYDVKERRWPAMQVLERMLAVKPQDKNIQERLKELRSRM